MSYKSAYFRPTVNVFAVVAEQGFAQSITGNIPSGEDDGFEDIEMQ